jgi:hypothetical protein
LVAGCSSADTSTRLQSDQSFVHALIGNNKMACRYRHRLSVRRTLFCGEPCSGADPHDKLGRPRRRRPQQSNYWKNSEPRLARHLAKHAMKTTCSEIMSMKRKYIQYVVHRIKYIHHHTCSVLCNDRWVGSGRLQFRAQRADSSGRPVVGLSQTA